MKASAGAVEHLLLCPVDDLPGALADLHSHGLRVAGSEADAPLTARQTDLRGPLAIVVGSEGQGLGPAVRRRCDVFMRIPMRGAVGSLNAAVAGSVLLFEAVAQRDPGRSRRRRATRADRRAPITRPIPRPDPARSPTTSPTPAAAPRIPRTSPPSDAEAPTAPTDRTDSRAADEPVPEAETELLPGEGAPAPTPRPTEATRPADPPRLTHRTDAALSFPGADGVICGMTLPVAPT